MVARERRERNTNGWFCERKDSVTLPNTHPPSQNSVFLFAHLGGRGVTAGRFPWSWSFCSSFAKVQLLADSEQFANFEIADSGELSGNLHGWVNKEQDLTNLARYCTLQRLIKLCRFLERCKFMNMHFPPVGVLPYTATLWFRLNKQNWSTSCTCVGRLCQVTLRMLWKFPTETGTCSLYLTKANKTVDIWNTTQAFTLLGNNTHWKRLGTKTI